MMQNPNIYPNVNQPAFHTNMMQPCYNLCSIQDATVHCIPMKLAHAYVPFQCMGCLFPPMKGLEAGTIFPELHRPYGVDPEYTIDA
ncbi:MAG: spore coat associated protein CotJA [Clostridium sp.]|nr:spore coat associated protein CotJA [Clostridium sp.]